MPDILDEFVAASHRDQRQPCKYTAAVARLKAADRPKAAQGMEALIEGHPGVTPAGVAFWFRQHGVNIPAQSFGPHRKQECPCFRPPVEGKELRGR